MKSIYLNDVRVTIVEVYQTGEAVLIEEVQMNIEHSPGKIVGEDFVINNHS